MDSLKPVIVPLLRFFFNITSGSLPLSGDPEFRPGYGGFLNSNLPEAKKRTAGKVQVTQFIGYLENGKPAIPIDGFISDGEWEVKVRFTAEAIERMNAPRLTETKRGFFVLEPLHTIPIFIPETDTAKAHMLLEIHNFKYIGGAGTQIVGREDKVTKKRMKNLKRIENELWIMEWVKRSNERYILLEKEKAKKRKKSMANFANPSRLPTLDALQKNVANDGELPTRENSRTSIPTTSRAQNVTMKSRSISPLTSTSIFPPWKRKPGDSSKQRVVSEADLEMHIISQETEDKPDWLPAHYLQQTRRGRKIQTSMAIENKVNKPESDEQPFIEDEETTDLFEKEQTEQTEEGDELWHEDELSPYSRAKRQGLKGSVYDDDVAQEASASKDRVEELVAVTQEFSAFNPFPPSLLTNDSSPSHSNELPNPKVLGKRRRSPSVSPVPTRSQLQKVPQSTQVQTTEIRPVKRKREKKRQSFKLGSSEDDGGEFDLGHPLDEEPESDPRVEAIVNVTEEVQKGGTRKQSEKAKQSTPIVDIDPPPPDDNDEDVEPRDAVDEYLLSDYAHDESDRRKSEDKIVRVKSEDDDTLEYAQEEDMRDDAFQRTLDVHHLEEEEEEGEDENEQEAEEFREFMTPWYMGPETGIPPAMQVKAGKVSAGIYLDWKVWKKVLESRQALRNKLQTSV